MAKAVLFCKGTLMRFATGFCAAFAKAAVLDSSDSAGLPASWADVAAGLSAAVGAGLSCANADRLNKRIRERDTSKIRFIVSSPSKFVAESQHAEISKWRGRTFRLPRLKSVRSMQPSLVRLHLADARRLHRCGHTID